MSHPLVRNLHTERDARLIGEWLPYDVQTVWWRLLTPAQRAERAPAFEALLRTRLDESTEPALKSIWFAGLRVAITPATVVWLHSLWRREATVPGLPLFETDETALADAQWITDSSVVD